MPARICIIHWPRVSTGRFDLRRIKLKPGGIDLPIRISATKPASEYPDDAARLQGAIASFKSTTSMQTKRFEINTGTSSIFGATALVDFETNKQITFTIDLADPLFEQFCRVRVSKMR